MVWLRRIALAALIVVLALWAVASSGPFKQWVAAKIKEQVSAALECDLGLARLEGNLIGHAVLVEPSLSKDGRVWFQARRVELSYSLLSFAFGLPRISSLDLDQPRLSLPLPDFPDSDSGPLRLAIGGVRLTGAELSAGGQLGDLRSVSGLDATGGITFGRRGMKAELRVAKATATLRDRPDSVEVSGYCRLQDETLWLEGLKLGSGGLELQASGHLQYGGKGRGVSLRLQAQGLDSGALPFAWPSWLPARQTAAVEAVGPSWDDLQFHAELSQGDTRLRGSLSQGDDDLVVSVDQSQGSWGQADGRVRLVSGKQGYDLDRAQAHFQGITVTPELMTDLPPAYRGGGFTGNLDIAPDQDGHLADLRLESSHIGGELMLGSAWLQVAWKGDWWQVRHLELKADWGELRAQGQADGKTADLVLDADVRRMEEVMRLATLAGMDFQGKLWGALKIHGSLNGRWSDPDLNLTIKADHGLESDAVTAGAASLELNMHGWEGRRGFSAELLARDVVSGEVELKGLRAMLKQGGGKRSLMVSGVGPELRFAGDLCTDDFSLPPAQVAIQGLRINLKELEGRDWVQRGRAVLQLQGGGISLQQMRLARGGQRLELSGSLDAKGYMEATVRAWAIGLATSLYEQERGSFSAKLDMQASLAGRLDQPALAVNGRLYDLKGPGLPPTEVEFRGNFQERHLSLSGKALIQGREALSLGADVDMELSLRPPVLTVEPGKQMEIHASADNMPLALLEPVAPFVSGLEGRLNMRLAMSGSLEDPRLQGDIAVDQGRLVIDQTGQEVGGIELRASLRSDRVVLERFNAVSGGVLRAKGEVVLPLGGPGRLNLELNGKGLLASMGLLGQLNADLEMKIGGKVLAPVIKGKVTPTSMFVRGAVGASDAEKDVVMLRRGQQPPPLGHESLIWNPTGPLGACTLDLAVDVSKELRVDREGGWIIVSGMLTVQKQPHQPLVYGGQINLLKGVIIMYGKRFEVLKGFARFDNVERPVPVLSAQAKLNTGQVSVVINVSGTSEDPVLSFSSNPPMSQADILSSIIYGRPARELSSGQSQQLSAQALALLGAAGQQEMERIFGPNLSPDVITVHESADEGSSVEAGKYLSQDLYLRYRHNLGPDGGTNVGLEYSISPHISLESQYGTTRDTGVDVVFSYEF